MLQSPSVFSAPMLYALPPDAQKPTHPRLQVRDARDAHKIFEAVRLGHLKPIVRRLNDAERYTHIKSGSIFVWEESDRETGLKRWTDGHVWSQSRMREPYLFYDEKISSEEQPEGSGQTARNTYRFVEGPSRTWSSSAQSHYERSEQRPTGLVKQAYSAFVTIPGTSRTRKWHLTAYFTYADLPNIPTVDKDPLLGPLDVPDGIYKSGRARGRGADTVSPVRPTAPSTVSAPLRTGSPRPAAQVTLPPLQQNGRRVHPRQPEDQRMIGMLNSNTIL